MKKNKEKIEEVKKEEKIDYSNANKLTIFALIMYYIIPIICYFLTKFDDIFIYLIFGCPIIGIIAIIFAREQYKEHKFSKKVAISFLVIPLILIAIFIFQIISCFNACSALG